MDYKKIDRLRQLDEMHYRGFITQEEEAERKALLTEIQEQARRDSVRGRERTMDAAGGGRSPSAVSPEVSGRRKLTFREAVAVADKQIDVDGFKDMAPSGKAVAGCDWHLAYTLAMVMAEVYMGRPDYQMYVGGIAMECRQIQEVYANLTHEHIAQAIRKIQGGKEKNARFRRPYLRTMLYNLVFEYEAQTQAGISQYSWDT